MKVHDSGMPDEAYWNTLFDVQEIVTWLQLENIKSTIVEVGCGYGTFTVPVAQNIKSDIVAYDIEDGMIDVTKRNLTHAGLTNCTLIQKDVVENGIALENDSCGMVLLFNILHFAERKTLLKEASRVLQTQGILAVIHWRKDMQTPRGPSLESRPSAMDIVEDGKEFNLNRFGNPRILEPYHWGVKLIKGEQ